MMESIQIINEMNRILETYSINEKLQLSNNISIIENTVIIQSNSDMHQILENYTYPPFEEMTVYHYTSEEVAKNIQCTNILRFYNILKRYTEGELKPFLKKFGFDNAFDDFDQLANLPDYENIFYASFVEVSDDETEEMRYFSELNDTKLKFRIKSTKGFFRKINYYDDEKYKLFLDLKDIAERHNKKFIVEGMSGRFASFCINEDYKIENEYRAYWRHWSQEDGFIVKQDENDDEYIEIRLGAENFSGITIELLDD